MSQYHVFSIPTSLLETLTPRTLFGEPISQLSQESKPTAAHEPQIATSSRACNICLGVTFTDVDVQREHFRSDWHRYNVKLRINGAQPVAETDFAKLVDSLEDSISGSESSADSSGSDSDAVNALANKAKRNGRSLSSTERKAAPQTAITWFHSPPDTQIGVYRAMFSQQSDPTAYLLELKEMQIPYEDGRTWALFMVAGGHFAGAIVRVSRAADDEDEADNKRKKHKKPKPDTEVLRHKTFHRYTTRRKQGGSQSANDNAKGPAKSAGALLRRYGEQALRDDIRNLLQDWAEELSACERIWIRASTSNRKIFMDYDGSVIAKGDDRLRTFPFPTRRPTQSELSRCLLELTRVKVSHLTEDALRAQDEAYLNSLPKPKLIPVVKEPLPDKPKPPVLTKEEEQLRDKWGRLLEMVSKGRLEPLRAFWEREASSLGGVNTAIPEWAGERHKTLLQVAARAGQADTVKWLLDEAGADPTIEVGDLDDEDDDHSDASDAPAVVSKGSRRTAYDLARTRAVRDVFRRCAGDHPEKWDWLGAGHVPSVLSKQMEEERDEKKKQRRKGLKERVKEREAREKGHSRSVSPEVVVQPAAKVEDVRSVGGPRRLGGSSGGAEGVAGLTPEMRAKVERERRARAAEARLKALGGG
ncbi:hypothetical protein PLEOSDRAFT_1057439 [Pleurotus ostreatus PC15]|uniref:VLRF1 domain-containing protein n=1 Tax=Pleurotus ostreatus (strain PC15) TaxID=1137138 RepID=A0A067NTL2_PLEO1|nr:hypothetical protein PLEOSDRAFT_1057439 [Pleurotus ostreatus PC15]